MTILQISLLSKLIRPQKRTWQRHNAERSGFYWPSFPDQCRYARAFERWGSNAVAPKISNKNDNSPPNIRHPPRTLQSTGEFVTPAPHRLPKEKRGGLTGSPHLVLPLPRIPTTRIPLQSINMDIASEQ